MIDVMPSVTVKCPVPKAAIGAEQNQLVESAGLLPIATKTNHDQPDDKNHSTNKIRPDHLAGNREESHNCRRIHYAAAHDDSFPAPAVKRFTLSRVIWIRSGFRRGVRIVTIATALRAISRTTVFGLILSPQFSIASNATPAHPKPYALSTWRNLSCRPKGRFQDREYANLR
jgi:hypothetical protein